MLRLQIISTLSFAVIMYFFLIGYKIIFGSVGPKVCLSMHYTYEYVLSYTDMCLLHIH